MAPRERAVQFGDGAGLVGVLSEPRGGVADEDERPALILLNAGLLHHVGPSRVHVTLARTLALKGYTTLRFDFSGIGDSEPRRDGRHFDEASVSEIRDAMDYLHERRGTTSFVVGGVCSGADASFRAALADARIVGLVQVDGYAYRNVRFYLHHYAPRLLRTKSWSGFAGRQMVNLLRKLGLGYTPTSPGWTTPMREFPPKEEVEQGLRALTARGVEQLHLYTAGQGAYQNYANQFWDNFRSVDFDGRAQVGYLAGADHTFTALDQQLHLVGLISGWMERTWGTSSINAA